MSNAEICARNVRTRSDQSMTFEDFLERSHTTSTFAEPEGIYSIKIPPLQ